jgi:hypothetical protein
VVYSLLLAALRPSYRLLLWLGLWSFAAVLFFLLFLIEPHAQLGVGFDEEQKIGKYHAAAG